MSSASSDGAIIEIHRDQRKVFLAAVLSLLFVSFGLFAIMQMQSPNCLRLSFLLFGVGIFSSFALINLWQLLVGATVLCKISKDQIWMNGKQNALAIPWDAVSDISRVNFARQWGQKGLFLKMTPAGLNKLVASKNLAAFRKTNQGVLINTSLFKMRFDEFERLVLDTWSRGQTA